MKERKFATGPSGGLQQEHLDVRRCRIKTGTGGD